MDMIGRKKALGVALLIAAVGWLVVARSISFGLFFSGQIVHGTGEGMVVAVSIVVMGEHIDEQYRGGAISSLNVSVLFGIETLHFCL